MESVLSVLSAAFLIAGSLLMVIGGIGVLRLPDVYARAHGAGLTDTLGAGFILIGLMLESGFGGATVRLILILLFLWFTSPLAGYALAKAALASGVRPIVGKEER